MSHTLHAHTPLMYGGPRNYQRNLVGALLGVGAHVQGRCRCVGVTAAARFSL